MILEICVQVMIPEPLLRKETCLAAINSARSSGKPQDRFFHALGQVNILRLRTKATLRPACFDSNLTFVDGANSCPVNDRAMLIYELCTTPSKADLDVSPKTFPLL